MGHIWGGKFLLRKHRLYTGDIANHLEVKSITRLDDDEIDEVEADQDDGVELVQISPGGGSPYLVEVTWKPNGEKAYEYIVWAFGEVVEHYALRVIAEYIEEENARRLTTGTAPIIDEG